MKKFNLFELKTEVYEYDELEATFSSNFEDEFNAEANRKIIIDSLIENGDFNNWNTNSGTTVILSTSRRLKITITVTEFTDIHYGRFENCDNTQLMEVINGNK